MKRRGKAAVLLAGGCFFSQVLFAYQPERAFWDQRRQAARDKGRPVLALAQPFNALSAQFPIAQTVAPSLSRSVLSSVPAPFLKDHGDILSVLSPAYGSIRKISLPKVAFTEHPPHPVGFRPVVVHIQDVHMNPEAQRNIRETVRLLLQTGRVDVMGLEGNTDQIDLQPFVDFPFRRAVEASADYVLRHNKITGPVHAAMTAHQPLPRIVGIDDPVHYAANIQAYRDAEPLLGPARHRVEEMLQKLDQEKRKTCSPALQLFDDAVRLFDDQKMSLGDFVLELTKRASHIPEPVHQFVQALSMERSLDFRRVEQERTALIRALAARLTPEETRTLLAHSVAYRAGTMGYGEFYDHLQKRCQSKDVDLARFPAMDAYVRYVLVADGIDAERLYENLAQMEKSIYAALAETNEERMWVARRREANWLKKLVHFSITPTDWTDNRPSIGRPQWAPFESFYKEAHFRDGAMAENVLRELSKSHGRVAVLVTGGYHANAIADRLNAQGVTVVSFVPKIEKVESDQGAAYLSVFSQEKTPIEKLFAGEKLFLGQNPAAGVPETALLSQAVSVVGDPAVSPRDLEKLRGYMARFYDGVKLSFDKLVQTKDGGWRVSVDVNVGDQSQKFSLVTDEKFNVLSFGLAQREERPPFGAWVEKWVRVYQWLGPWAARVSPWTESFLFAGMDFWTPANYLWFARRHTVGNVRDLTLLLVWAAFRSSEGGRGQRVRGPQRWGRFFGSWIDHRYWNGLGLFTLAANKGGADLTAGGGDHEVHPSDPAHPDFKELKVLGPKNMELALNGRLKVIARMVIRKGRKYLLLEKPEKGTERLKLDVPGGGAAGEELGVNIGEGARREVREELKILLSGNEYHQARDLGLNSQGFRLYSIPGPKTNFSDRRPTLFRRIDLPPHTTYRIKTSSEHKGYLWLTLPKVLERFSDLNTGPKMAFYLEFLREAYGITGVRSLRSLTDTHRLKSMTDSVLIETDRGWFLWNPNGDPIPVDRMGFEIDRAMERVRNKKSVLAGWENPTVSRVMGENTRPVIMVMWRLKKVGDLAVPDLVAPNGSSLPGPNRSRARINFLASQVPPNAQVLTSVRFFVRQDENYVFLKKDGHKNECPGGVGVTAENLPSILENQMGIRTGTLSPADLMRSESPLITHKVGDGANFEFFKVIPGSLSLNPQLQINSDVLVVLNYGELKDQYYNFTLATRMLIVKEIIQKEYGLHVTSIKPIGRIQERDVAQILLTTQNGNFIFRKANTIADVSKKAIPVLKKSDGSNGYYVNVGGTNFILTDQDSQVHHYQTIERRSRVETSGQLAERIPKLRAIAWKISKASIWKELLEAQKAISSSTKADGSVVTEWDYKLQAAFVAMIQYAGLQAHVVGEESPLSPQFLEKLTKEGQNQLIDLVSKNAANVPDGLVFFVDPIDGTKSFTQGHEKFAFTFGVLFNGKPLYAATYLPATGDLYEAVVEEGVIYKNGQPVTTKRETTPFVLKVQRMLQESWERVDPKEFPKPDYFIPSIAVESARMAAGEEGAASALVLNPKGIFPWDLVPGSIFLLTAGLKVTNFNGKSVLSHIKEYARKGVPPRQWVSQFLAAWPDDSPRLLKTVLRVHHEWDRSPPPSRATSLWMTKWFEVIGSWVDKYYQMKGRAPPETSFEVRFGLHYKRNAPRYEWGIAAGAMVASLFWGGGIVGGLVFAGLFAVSHLPIFKLNTDVKVGLFKVFVMAVFYGALVAFTLGILFELVNGVNQTNLVNLLFTIVAWHVAYGLHRQFDPPWRTTKSAHVDGPVKPLSLAYWALRYFQVSEPLSRAIGGVEMSFLQIPLLIAFRLVTEQNVGPLFLIGLVYLFWGNFVLMAKVADGEGKDPPPLKQLVGPLAVFAFLLPTYYGLALGAFMYFIYFVASLVDPIPDPKRILSAPEETKKNQTIRLVPSVPDGIDPNSENVLSVRVLVKIDKEKLRGSLTQYLFVKNQDGRWEVPGGGGKPGESISNVALREIEEELGIGFIMALRRLGFTMGQQAQFVHEIANMNGKKSYRAVRVVQAEPKYPPNVRLNDESLAHRWMTLNQARRMFMGFTLNTRMTLLNPLLEAEYGIKEIVSIVPYDEAEKSDVVGPPLLIKTEAGQEFILRHQDQGIRPLVGKTVNVVPRRKTFFQRSDTLLLSRQPMVLEKVVQGISDGSKEEKVKSVPDVSSIAYWIARYKGLDEPVARRLGLWGLWVEVAALIGFRLWAQDPIAQGQGLFSLLGYDPVSGPLFAMGIVLFAWLHYFLMYQIAKTEGDSPPPIKVFWKNLGLFVFYFIPGNIFLGIGIAVHVIKDLYSLAVDSIIRGVYKTTGHSVHVKSIDDFKDGRSAGEWVTLKEMMHKKLLQYSLETRMAFLTEILKHEYGIENIVSIAPVSPGPAWVDGPPLLITTRQGEKFIFRSAGKDLASARFNVAVQTLLELKGVPVRSIVSPNFPNEIKNPHVLKLAGHPMVLEVIGQNENTVSIEESTETHFYKMGQLAGQVDKAFHELNMHGNSLVSNLLIAIHLDHVKFNDQGDIVAVDLYPIPPGWGARQDVLIGMGVKVGDVGKLDNIVEGYNAETRPLSDSEKQDVWRSFNHWMSGVSAFGAFLMVLGQWVPVEYMTEFFGAATLAGARFGYGVHKTANREWLVNQLDLTSDEQKAARDILRELDGRSLRLGVEEIQSAVLGVADDYSRRKGGGTFESVASGPSNGSFYRICLVDPITMGKAPNVQMASDVLKRDPNLIFVVAKPVDGLPLDRLLVVPDAFSSYSQTSNDIYVEVAMEKVESQLPDFIRAGSVQLFQTPFLKPNYDKLEQGSILKQAQERALVLIFESMRVFPAATFRWSDVLAVMRALAQAA